MSGGGTNTVQSTTIPSSILPYVTSNLANMQGLESQGGPQMQQGIAGLNQMQLGGIGSIAGAAGQPNANSAANSYLQNLESGQYLSPNSNPYLAQEYQTALQGSQNQIASQFAGAGSNVMNSIPVQQNAAADLAGQIYAPAYQQGLQSMTQGAALAPATAQAQYLPGQELLQTGAGLQQQSQNVLNAQNNMYNYSQALPYQLGSWYSSLLGSNTSPFGQSSQTQMPVVNPWATAAGGALAGGATGAEIGSIVPGLGTGVGALIGAGVGGLGGGLLG